MHAMGPIKLWTMKTTFQNYFGFLMLLHSKNFYHELENQRILITVYVYSYIGPNVASNLLFNYFFLE